MRQTHGWKIWMLCLTLVLCVMALSACQQQETFTTEVTQAPQAQEPQQEQSAQDLFSGAVVESTNYDDGSYDPASEEGGDTEDVEDVPAAPGLHFLPEEQAEPGDRRDVQVEHGLDAVQVFRLQFLEEEHPGIVDQHVREEAFPAAPLEEVVGGVLAGKVRAARADCAGQGQGSL